MLCDTFDDVPDSACNALWVNELMFGQLRHFVGPVFTGQASQAYGSGDLHWGRAISLAENETLEMRIYPRGIISSGHLLDMRNMVMMLASRRRGPIGKDHVTLAVLWHQDHDIDLRFSPFDALRETTQSVAARNLHIVLPSLFSHHDGAWGGAPADKKPKMMWPAEDQSNFHAVRPSSYSVHRLVKMPKSDQALRTITAGPGISQFVIAGHLAGTDVKDKDHHATDPIAHGEWIKMIHDYSKQIQEAVGYEAGLAAMHNSMTLTDLLTGEGFLALLGHSFSGGALPDLMHSPGGFPLIIAFMSRLACYPGRYNLIEGTPADQLANRELMSLFEANWSPIHPSKVGGRNIYAIDLVIRGAHTEARQEAMKQAQTEAPVEDNLTFWHRAGQRCNTAVFGPQLDDFLAPRCSFGRCERMIDPLAEARNSVLQKQFTAADAVTGNTGRVTNFLATVQDKRNILLRVLNSVEHWLRTGMYCGMALNDKRRNPEVKIRVKRSGVGQQMLSRDALRDALDKGMEDSVKDALATGEASTVEKARLAAKIMRDGIEGALTFNQHGEVDFNDLSMRMPVGLADESREALLTGERASKTEASKSSIDDPLNVLQGVDVDEEMVCEQAVGHAVNLVSSAMCQGPMVHHEFQIGCFLSNSNAIIKCANCDADVHLLSAAFLTTRQGACQLCRRPRCIPCTALSHSKQRSAPLNSQDSSQGCMRCTPQQGPKTKRASAVSPPTKSGKKKNK